MVAYRTIPIVLLYNLKEARFSLPIPIGHLVVLGISSSWEHFSSMSPVMEHLGKELATAFASLKQ